MRTAHLSRERWVYGLHALAGLLLGLPTLGFIGDALLGAPEAFLSFVAVLLWLSFGWLLPVVALGWAMLVGYWLWTGDARRRWFLVAWYASAALILVPFWPLSGVNVFTVVLSLVGVLATTLILPLGYWR